MKARSQSCSIPKKRSKTLLGAKTPGEKWDCARALRESTSDAMQKRLKAKAAKFRGQ